MTEEQEKALARACRKAVRIVAAGDWLAKQAVRPSPVIPTLRLMFQLTAAEAVAAIRAANQFRRDDRDAAGR